VTWSISDVGRYLIPVFHFLHSSNCQSRQYSIWQKSEIGISVGQNEQENEGLKKLSPSSPDKSRRWVHYGQILVLFCLTWAESLIPYSWMTSRGNQADRNSFPFLSFSSSSSESDSNSKPLNELLCVSDLHSTCTGTLPRLQCLFCFLDAGFKMFLKSVDFFNIYLLLSDFTMKSSKVHTFALFNIFFVWKRHKIDSIFCVCSEDFFISKAVKSKNISIPLFSA
jgi:hypothetical protein